MKMVRPTATFTLLLGLLCALEVSGQTTQWPAWTSADQFRPSYPATFAPYAPFDEFQAYQANEAPGLAETPRFRYQVPVYQSEYWLHSQAVSLGAGMGEYARYPQTGLPNHLQRAGVPLNQNFNSQRPWGNAPPVGGEQRPFGTFGASMFAAPSSNERQSDQAGTGKPRDQERSGSDKKPDENSSDPKAKNPALDNCASCVRPYWEVDVDLVGLRRRKPNDFPLIIDQASGSGVINSLDLDFDYKLGLHAALIHQFNSGFGWEMEFLGIPTWEGSRVVTGGLQLNGPGFDLAVDPGVFAVDYSSNLYSFELNARQSNGYRWSCFAGFRYIRLNDDLLVSELNTPLLDVLEIDTQNNLYGLQLGGDLLVYDRGGPLNGSIELKVGVYGNDVRQNTRSTILMPPVSLRAKKPVLAGEMEFLLTYALNSRLRIRGSYKLVGLGGVALAPDQIGASDLSTGRAAIHYNSLLLDGGLLGVEYEW